MKVTATSAQTGKSQFILQKLLELKKTLSSNTETSLDDGERSIRSGKNLNSSLDELQTDTDLDSSTNPSERMELIQSNIIGLRTVLKSPFGFDL
jgi:hypothetical protein